MSNTSETIPVGQLAHVHLGMTVHITLGSEGFSTTDMIVGVWHQAALVSDTRVDEAEDHWEIGRAETTVSLARAGDVALPPSTVVTVSHTER